MQNEKFTTTDQQEALQHVHPDHTEVISICTILFHNVILVDKIILLMCVLMAKFSPF